jgi:hypothetical protein
MALLIKRSFLPIAALAAVVIATPAVARASEIYVNNMSDVAVQLTVYNAATPAKVVATWCVDTGDYGEHVLKDAPALLQADVMQVGCKEPVILGRKLSLMAVTPKTPATLFRLSGVAGKYDLTGPYSHDLVK